jgi:membrane protein
MRTTAVDPRGVPQRRPRDVQGSSTKVPGISAQQRFLITLVRAGRNFWLHGDLFSGAAISYYSLFSLLPMGILLLLMIQFLFPSQRIEETIAELFGRGANGDILIRTLKDAYEQRESLGWEGGVALILAATGVFGAVQGALDKVWESRGRLLPGRFAVGIFVMTGSLMVFLGAFLMTILVSHLFQFGDLEYVLGLPPIPSLDRSRAVTVTAALAQFGLFVVGYRFLPSVPVKWRDVWPGAILGSVLWQVIGYLLGQYIGGIASYTTLYHSLGVLIALLTWVYALSCTFLFGAEFVAEWSLRRATQLVPERRRWIRL